MEEFLCGQTRSDGTRVCALCVHIDHSSCNYINYNRPCIGFVSKTFAFSAKYPIFVKMFIFYVVNLLFIRDVKRNKCLKGNTLLPIDVNTN